MSALLESMRESFAKARTSVRGDSNGDASRRQALEEALRDGLPGPRSEAWKYTSLRALERRSFAPAPAAPAAVDAALLADIPAPRLVFVNGRHAPALSDLGGLPDGVELRPLSSALAEGGEALRFLGRRFERSDEVFARLNAALADEGVLLRVDEGVAVAAPLHLVFVGTAPDAHATDHAWHLRHLIELRRGASLALVEHHLHDGEAAHLGNVLAHVHLAQGARLDHARIQSEAAGLTSLLRTDAVLARDADYRRVDLELGAGLTRHELNVRLEGDRARLVANGVLLGNGKRHIDTRLGIEHIARDTTAGLLWRGVGADRSRVVFHGGIHIREGADGTDARLSNKNLLLSANAEIDTQPVLVIDADEVQAAHGATVGQLDPQALFYLRSRGIPRERAQQLLSAAFCHEPLAALEGPIAGILATRLDQALSSAGVA
ncbi:MULTISPECIES: Fe-S cluster assembly protein SufD [Gammaproteobacteria]|uniref:Fe-S cluster assembly protein SufD n=1 Tax=Xanthomonas boreopolis TaxID=86183 RepID=A0A919F629_9XANT|nr:Fe-S cluster assembly protein SufD [Pseudomonas sp. Hp2]GHH48229.1 Fe-S cluster assembly protein SufD [[Pseudomonas] boreopolis]